MPKIPRKIPVRSDGDEMIMNDSTRHYIEALEAIVEEQQAIIRDMEGEIHDLVTDMRRCMSR